MAQALVLKTFDWTTDRGLENSDNDMEDDI